MPLNDWHTVQGLCLQGASTSAVATDSNVIWVQSTIASTTLATAFTYAWPQISAAAAVQGWTASYTWYSSQGTWLAHQRTAKAPAALSQRTRKRLRREQREWDAMQAREKTRREEVQKRARALLTRNLSPDQRDSLERNGYFDLNIGGRHYRVRQGTHGNVRLVVGDREITSYCIQPDGVPTEDAMLAQKLLLETDEASFLRIANARQLAPAPSELLIERP